MLELLVLYCHIVPVIAIIAIPIAVKRGLLKFFFQKPIGWDRKFFPYLGSKCTKSEVVAFEMTMGAGIGLLFPVAIPAVLADWVVTREIAKAGDRHVTLYDLAQEAKLIEAIVNQEERLLEEQFEYLELDSEEEVTEVADSILPNNDKYLFRFPRSLSKTLPKEGQ